MCIRDRDTILQGLLNNTTVGQTDITKHMLLLWAQALEPSIKDGREVGLAISQLVYDGYLIKQNPENEKPRYYERVL